VPLACSARNRSVFCRIPHVTSPKAKRVEVRFPDVAFRTRSIPERAWTRTSMTCRRRGPEKIPTVCGSLREALSTLDKGRDFLKKGGVFTDDMIDACVELKAAYAAAIESRARLYFSRRERWRSNDLIGRSPETWRNEEDAMHARLLESDARATSATGQAGFAPTARSGRTHRTRLGTARRGVTTQVSPAAPWPGIGCFFDRGAAARAVGSHDALGFAPASVDLADVVVAAAQRNWPAAECCGVTLVVATRRLPPFLADARLLTEALDRLIFDAISAAGPDETLVCDLAAAGAEAMITVRTRSRSRSCGRLLRALHPFELDARQHALGAPDLELWVARLVAERHRGRIELCDSVGDACAGVRLVLPLLGRE